MRKLGWLALVFVLACGAADQMARVASDGGSLVADAGKMLVDAGTWLGDAGSEAADAGEREDGSAHAQAGGLQAETYQVDCVFDGTKLQAVKQMDMRSVKGVLVFTCADDTVPHQCVSAGYFFGDDSITVNCATGNTSATITVFQ